MKEQDGKEQGSMKSSQPEKLIDGIFTRVGYRFFCNTCQLESELYWQHSECLAKCREHVKSTGHCDVNVFPCYFLD